MSDIGYGRQDPNSSSDDLNKIAFLVQRMINRLSTMKLVKIVEVHGGGPAATPATVDVLPLVNQVDGSNNSEPHGTVYGLACWRLQGGAGAVVLDPKVGDIGYVVCADRDVSNVKSTRAQANPGSSRKYNLADGVYVGGVLNDAPTSFVHFKDDGGIKVSDALGNVLETSAAGFVVTTAPGGHFVVNGISATLHVHPVTTAPGTTGPPA